MSSSIIHRVGIINEAFGGEGVYFRFSCVFGEHSEIFIFKGKGKGKGEDGDKWTELTVQL